MARLPRFFLPGGVHHVMQRGNNRSPLFFAPADYQLLLTWLRQGARRHGCALHPHVLMTNYVSLVVTPDQATSLPFTMQSLGRRYVQHVNTTDLTPT